MSSPSILRSAPTRRSRASRPTLARAPRARTSRGSRADPAAGGRIGESHGAACQPRGAGDSGRRPRRARPVTRHVGALLTLAFVATTAPLADAAPPASLSAEEALDAAEVALHRGSFREALAHAGVVHAEAADTDHRLQSQALTIRGRTLMDLGVFGEAHDALDAALAMLVNTPEIDLLVTNLVARAELLWRQGRSDEARRVIGEAAAWSDALPDRPVSAEVELARGRLAGLDRRHDDALERYRAARLSCAGAPACEARADLGAAFVHLAMGDANRARRDLAPAWSTLARLGLHREEARAAWGLARAHRALGELASAGARADDAIAIASRLGDRPLLADLHRLRAEVILDAAAGLPSGPARDDEARALEHLEEAQHHYLAMHSAPGVAASRLMLGRLAAARGRYGEATLHGETARRAFTRIGDRTGRIHAARLLAEIARTRGDVARETELITEALALDPAPYEATQLWTRRGAIAHERGDIEGAIASYEAAVDAADALPIGAGGRCPAGGAALDRDRPCGSAAGRESARRARLAAHDALLASLLDARARSPERVVEALTVSERSVARAFSDVLERARIEREDPRVATLIARLEHLDRARAELLDTRRPGPGDARRADALRDEQAQIEAALLGQASRWTTARGVALRDGIAQAVADGRAQLAPGVVILKYHLAEPTSWAFVIARGEVEAVPLAPRSELAPLVRRFADSLAQPAATSAARRAQSALGRELYARLLSPLHTRLDGAHRLVIVPHLELRLLPFDALIVPTGSARADERAQAEALGTPLYVVYRHTVSYAPSVAAIAELANDARRRVQRPRHPFVAFADPIFTGAAAALPRLASSQLEASGARALMDAGAGPGTLFMREEATEERLKSLALGRYRVVHLATHGFAPDTISGDDQPALFLGSSAGEDGVLSLAEVIDLRLDADLVVLSACSSGRGSLDPGDGLGGLTQAFLYAGSAAVMATLWAVEDRHAALMMDTFYQRYSAGDTSPDALRDARLALLSGAAVGGPGALRGIGGVVGDEPPPRPGPRGRRPARAADPFFWASYMIVGETGDILR